MEQKREYTSPEIEVTVFPVEDIITTSGYEADGKYNKILDFWNL